MSCPADCLDSLHIQALLQHGLKFADPAGYQAKNSSVVDCEADDSVVTVQEDMELLLIRVMLAIRFGSFHLVVDNV